MPEDQVGIQQIPTSTVSIPPTDQPPPSKSSKLLLIVFGVILILTVVGGGGFYAMGKKAVQQPKPTLKTSRPASNKTAADFVKSVEAALPIDVKSPAVKGATLSYTAAGNITEVKEIKDNNQKPVINLSTDIKGKTMDLSYILGDKTEVVFDNQGKITPAKISDLKAGQAILITYVDNLKTKKWTVKKIVIINSSPSTESSSSATVKN